MVYSKPELVTNGNVFSFSSDPSTRRTIHRGLLKKSASSASKTDGSLLGGPFVPGKNGPFMLCRPAGFCACVLKFGAFAGACAPTAASSSGNNGRVSIETTESTINA